MQIFSAWYFYYLNIYAIIKLEKHRRDKKMSEYISYKYNKTFSGTDTIAFVVLPASVPICLGSLTTISYSILRNKKPVINIGRTNVNGFTRGSRICAGTMVFTLINQHWVRELQDSPGMNYIKDIADLKADELPLFDIMIISANEYGSWCSMYISGVDFSDEAQTISVEDLFTENVFQFVARDVSSFRTKYITNGINSEPNSKGSNFWSKIAKSTVAAFTTTTRTYILSDSGNTEEDVVNEERLRQAETDVKVKKRQDRIASTKKYLRDLYEKSDNFYIGQDVEFVQEQLSKIYTNVNITGIFDHDTAMHVKLFQQENGLIPDGVVNRLTFAELTNIGDPEIKNISISTLSGAYVYNKPYLNADINYKLEYGEVARTTGYVTTIDPNGLEYRFYKIDEGYVYEGDTFSRLNMSYNGKDESIPDSILFINNIKNALSSLYGYVPDDNGMVDSNDSAYIKRFQLDNDLNPSGEISPADYKLLMEKVNKSNGGGYEFNGFSISFSIQPGTYTIKLSSIDDMTEFLSRYYATITCGPSSVNIRVTAISLFKNKSLAIYNRTVEVSDGESVDISLIKDAFNYGITAGDYPITVEVVIYPHNEYPYKWIFNIIK